MPTRWPTPSRQAAEHGEHVTPERLGAALVGLGGAAEVAIRRCNACTDACHHRRNRRHSPVARVTGSGAVSRGLPLCGSWWPTSAGRVHRMQAETAALDTGLSTQIADLRTEQRTQLAEVRTEIAALEERPVPLLGLVAPFRPRRTGPAARRGRRRPAGDRCAPAPTARTAAAACRASATISMAMSCWRLSRRPHVAPASTAALYSSWLRL